MEKQQFILEFEKPIRDLHRRIEELQKLSQEHDVDVTGEIAQIERKIGETEEAIFANLTPWQRIQVARHPQRPYAPSYIEEIFDGFQELHGDRSFGDDQALTGGTAYFDGRPVMILSQQKGKDTKENIRRNFGMPQPEGYRKARRLFQMAEKFNLPLICFIDTPGAFPGLGSEERHVAEAIAVNLRDLSALEVPSVGVVLGEGGSGGALGIGVTDRMLVLENAYYSVISPEGCAAILWKDRAHAARAAAALRISANDLLEFGIADEIIPEPFGGAHRDFVETAKSVKAAITKQLDGLRDIPIPTLLDKRYERFRRIGAFEENVITKMAPADDRASGGVPEPISSRSQTSPTS